MTGVNNGSGKKNNVSKSTPYSTFDRGATAPRVQLDKTGSVLNGKLEQRNGASATTVDRKNYQWTQISPALYATPEATPLPDSPSSFSPSPYTVNHKRRGPRLLKSYSKDDVALRNPAPDEAKLDNDEKHAKKEAATSANDNSVLPNEIFEFQEEAAGTSTIQGPIWDKSLAGISDGELV